MNCPKSDFTYASGTFCEVSLIAIHVEFAKGNDLREVCFVEEMFVLEIPQRIQRKPNEMTHFNVDN
jgi:hypothetical protein